VLTTSLLSSCHVDVLSLIDGVWQAEIDHVQGFTDLSKMTKNFEILRNA
jgi:hypothetical protein